MDAKQLEEKQSMQAQFAVLSRNAHEEKQIEIASLSAKLRVRDNEISALQEFRDKYHQMMRETPVLQQWPEPVTPLAVPPVGIPPAGAHPAGTNRFKKPPNSSDPDSPAIDSGAHQREEEDGEELLEDQTLTLTSRLERLRIEIQIPRNLKPVTSFCLHCHFRQDFTYVWRSSLRDAVTASYEYNPDAAHIWITAIAKPTAIFDLKSICEPRFAALDAKLIKAKNTLPNSRNDDLARQLINLKEAAVKKEAGRLKGIQLLCTVYEYYKFDPRFAVLLNMIDLVKTKLHGDKFAEFLTTYNYDYDDI